MRKVLFALLAFFVTAEPAWTQEKTDSNEVSAGHRLAILICANCHVAAQDQPNDPILRPPAESFVSTAQRKSVNADWLQSYLKTTHRGLDNPKGMPNPDLSDSQVRQVAAYILSLRKKP
jgi:mono/diheme cytochrome c family protein